MRLLAAAFVLVALLASAGALQAFTVVKNVTRPPVEKRVLFDRATAGSAPPPIFFASGAQGLALAPDGSLRLRMDRNEAIEAGFRFSADGSPPAPFSVTDFNYIVVTCRLEGASRQTLANGQVISRRPDNLWCSFVLFDERGRPVAQAGLADAAPDGKTPAETVTLRLPMILFTFWGENPRPPIHGFGFAWSAARPPAVRDYTLVIERVVLAD